MNLLFLCGALAILASLTQSYDANWDSIESRPLPEWFDQAKIGIFIHWGIYSVPAVGNEWFWWHMENDDDEVLSYLRANYPPNWTYQDFGPGFKAEHYNPGFWADLFKKAGARYVVLTAKHHEGYTLWPSKYSYSWNVGDVGPQRDVLGDLANAVRDAGLHWGLYHSLLEWYHPVYNLDKQNNWETQYFVDQKVMPEMYELVNTYEPEILWSDGNWESPDSYWKATEFIAWLYNDSPVRDTIVVNDRWGQDTQCQHGGYFTCTDRYNPGTIQPYKWENAFPLDKYSYGYRRTAPVENYVTIDELLENVISTVSCGGNALIDIGPTSEGLIMPLMEERLLQLGQWLDINGEAIYETRPWSTQNDTETGNVWYTAKGDTVYAMALQWPQDDTLRLRAAAQLFGNPQVTLLGNDGQLSYDVDNDVVSIHLPSRAVAASPWAWTVKIG